MLSIQKRGKVYRAVGFVGGKRLRFSLGTRDADSARRLLNRIERTVSEGRGFAIVVGIARRVAAEYVSRVGRLNRIGWRERVEKPEPTWTELSAAFECEMRQRMALGKLQLSTAERYRQTIGEFALFLSERNVSNLKDITRPLIEAFKVWRVSRIREKKFSRGATSIALDAAIVHRVFSFAVENEMVVKNPVRMEGKPGAEPTRGAQPFNGEEIKRMRQHAGEDLLAFLL